MAESGASSRPLYNACMHNLLTTSKISCLTGLAMLSLEGDRQHPKSSGYVSQSWGSVKQLASQRIAIMHTHLAHALKKLASQLMHSTAPAPSVRQKKKKLFTGSPRRDTALSTSFASTPPSTAFTCAHHTRPPDIRRFLPVCPTAGPAEVNGVVLSSHESLRHYVAGWRHFSR